MSYGLEVLDRIDVENDPVNWVDLWGLISCNDARYSGISYCINQFKNDLEKCNDPCNETKNQVCRLAANLNFSNCLSNAFNRCSEDLNGDGKVDAFDTLLWFSTRRLWDFTTPPGSPYPPGYGDEGPGAIDPRYIPVPPQT